MSQIRKFSQFSFRDLVATAGPTIVLIAAVCVLAYVIVDPAPPRHVSVATGQENGAYEQFAKKYATALARDGIQVSATRSLGSQENLQLLNDGKVDVAFVQSGSTNEAEAQRKGLVSL
ncbi:MAG: C4-dicarboxylate transporter substrate-binding protein, partial [Massilia sp.]|nr:C4-dicarboxylate transporter substrate-binding protein [Massilia sp.]